MLLQQVIQEGSSGEELYPLREDKFFGRKRTAIEGILIKSWKVKEVCYAYY